MIGQGLEPKKRVAYYIRKGKEISYKLKLLQTYEEEPVSIQEFVEGRDFLNQPDVLYPKVMTEISELNTGKYIEAVLTGGIGTGKTTVALFTTAYQLYLLSLMRDPHKEFAIAPSDEIVFIFQSITSTLAKSVDYMRFKHLVMQSEYFNSRFRFDRTIESELRFPKRIIVKPVSGSDKAAIGQNVFGGIIDEVNFMAVTENSKNSRDGGTYDQAWENYRAIVRRRESRFMKQGQLPGMLCLVSSKQYPGEFTDIKIQEQQRAIQRYGESNIFVYDKRVWDVKPIETFSGNWFNVFVGDETRKPRIMEPEETLEGDDRRLVLEVPEEYRNSFEQDLLAALRDIGGVSTLALHPFIMEVEKVAHAFGRKKSVLSANTCDFAASSVKILKNRFQRLTEPRFVHIDLALAGDSAGIACGYVDGFEEIDRGDFEREVLPRINIDFILEVRPPKSGEINFAKIRTLLYKLRENGLPIKWVTLDSYQSADMIQILAQRGFMTGNQSIDTSTIPYDILKTSIYDERLLAPSNSKAQDELVKLERVPQTQKIDHPPSGSKDCSDALAGVAYGLTRRREIWLKYGVMSKIPSSVLNQLQKTPGKRSIEAKEAA